MRDAPIGIFDSGVGGLTVVSAVARALPGEDILYLGDTARVPYGQRSPETVRRYAVNAARFLVERGIKALVIACNTASAVALERVREEFDLPTVGVIGPGARAAALATRSFRVGVIGTPATVGSGSYTAALAAADSRVEVYARACPLFVPLAEEGWTNDEVARLIAHRYLDPLLERDIDTLVLGCTHYPLLRGAIGAAVGPGVHLVESGEAVAAELAERLDAAALLAGRGAGASCRMFVTDLPAGFDRVASRFLGESVAAPGAELVDL